MESPVRICLSAVFVVHLLLLSSTIETSHGMPHESNATTVGDDKPRTTRHNSTWLIRKPKTPDVALNELHPKDSVSEEHTDKNAKYKDRGRVRFHSQIKASTQSTLRRRSTSTQAPSSTQPVTLIIVTPTPEVKKPAQIIDSMRTYKKTKMPIVVSSSTPLPSSVKTESKSEEHQEYEDGEEEEEADNYEKYTSGKFSDNFFSIPSYNDDTNHDSEGAYNRLKAEFNKPYSSFSTYFPEASYGPNNDDEPYKSESFYNFDSELTTPKHDFFDKKYEEISKSIMKNLETAKAKQPKVNNTNVFKIVKENTGLEKLNNGTPSNKSTVIIKNTKEVRLLDNEKAGTANKELSDVHGTSIYYEMSVLSTETYNINLNDEDCDNDTLPDPTPSTSSEEELASLKATQPTLLPASTQAGLKPEAISTLSSNYIPVSSVEPTYFSSTGALPYSVDPFTSTERTTRIFTSNFSRNRSYSKRLNLAGVKDSPNSVTSRTDIPISNQNIRGPTRKFHYTTPKIKPVWMAPRRNITRTSYPRTTTPATIYSEHFSIKNRTTVQPKTPSRTTLTTVSSEIDPVLQGDVSGVKKIVHSQSILDNSIPTLWKRGSTRYSTSTATTSTEVGSGVSDLEIPPTLTAWALASLRSPPSLGPINTTATTKSVDENELQKVGDLADKRETTTTSTTVKTTSSSINNDIIPNKINDIEQNKLPWRPLLVPTSSSETHTEIVSIKPESQSTDTNISVQNSDKVTSTTEKLKPEENNSEISKESSEENSQWIPVTAEVDKTTTTITETETIPPVDATKSTGFESITKLPSELTTPHDDSASSEQKTKIVTEESVPPTTDYEITTIRFSYKPTEVATETESETETETSTNSWHAVYPTRTKTTTIKDEPITTYRPQYTTTDTVEELTTIIPEATVAELAEELTEVTTQAAESTETTVTAQSIEQTTATTEKPTPEPTSTTITVVTESTSEPEDTTTMIVEVVTEINTERQRPSSTEATSYEVPSTEMTETPPNEMRDNDSSSEENSGSNEVITQETTRPHPTTTQSTTKHSITTDLTTEELLSTTHLNAKLSEPTVRSTTIKEDVETTRVGEDVTQDGDTTTEASSIVLNEEAGSGAAIAIAVSTIGVTALILLVGLLLVVRRRGRRGVYAQRCTPVSLDAYSLDSVSVGHRKGRLRVSKRSYGNPAYDDEVTSHPMQYAALANFALDVESISAEFAEIPSVTVRPDEVPPGCEDKNRYSNVLPLPETRVQLKRIGNDPTSEYINANYITGPGNIRNYYIACQAPLPNTVVDFWRMIWEQNSRVVVMLTEYMENGVEKCYEYLPPSEISDNKRTFGDFQIILMKREQRDKYAVSSVQLINLATRTWREITHLWYFWPAKGVPEDYDSVIDFLSEMRSYMKVSQAAKEYDEEGVEVIYGDQSRSSFHNLSKFRSDDPGSGNGVNVYSPARAEEQMRREGRNGTLGRGKADEGGIRPCTVVCASGAGRSAALIAADVCARALAAAAVDVPRVVRELRAQRPHSLSNRHHYIFLYKLLSEYGNKLMGGGVDTI